MIHSLSRPFRRACREPGSARWFRNHEEFFAVYWRKKFRWLPEIHTTSLGDDGDGAHHTLFGRWLWFSFNLTLCKSSKGDPVDGPSYGWGWHFIDDTLSLNFGARRITVDLPFFYAYHQDVQILHPDTRRVLWSQGGKKVYETWDERKAIEAQNQRTYPYRYICQNGEVQVVQAKVHIERRIWRRKWTPLKIIRTSIDIQFSEEVGERRGSWKGGCISCGYPLLRGETVEQCLRRMEAERKFN